MRELEPNWQQPGNMERASLTWNLAPSQRAWVVTKPSGEPGPRCMTWGFCPDWAKPGSPKPINARAETAADKPYFRDAWRNSRCVVPADGYYEWQVRPEGKQPFHISLASGRPMLMAGLCTYGRENSRGSFAVVTVASVGLLAELHGRTPLVMEPRKANAWLDIDTPSNIIREMSSTSCGQEWAWHPVSVLVNNPGNDGAELVRECS